MNKRRDYMEPILDYVYGKEIPIDSGVVSQNETSDTRQYYEVISVGPGRYEHGKLIRPSVREGDTVIIQKHAAEGDTPPDMLNRGYALFMASRCMAVRGERKPPEVIAIDSLGKEVTK